MEHLPLFRPAVYTIPDKDDPTIGMAKDASIVTVSHPPQQSAQNLCVTVNIANYVVSTLIH
jgi:hypothetical protein